MRFWDSSAVVPLIVQQKTSGVAERWLTEDGEIVIWTLTPVEVISALWRLVRAGQLKETGAVEAESNLARLERGAHVMRDVSQASGVARRLLRVHSLRAGDALQLAAAWMWTEGNPSENTLHTFDNRLTIAARREGFRVPQD